MQKRPRRCWLARIRRSTRFAKSSVDIRDDDLRADEVIRGIRSLVGRREIQIQPVDLNRTITHVLRLVSGDALFRRVRIQRSLDESLPLVAADQPQIEQVLLNLIVNGMDAMQATPEAARELTVQTRLVRRGHRRNGGHRSWLRHPARTLAGAV